MWPYKALELLMLYQTLLPHRHERAAAEMSDKRTLQLDCAGRFPCTGHRDYF